MAKKTSAKTTESLPNRQSAPNNQPSKTFTLHNIIPVAVCMLYFVVHFLPDLEAYDAMGPQWLYMILLDMAVLLFILAKKDEYSGAATSIFRNGFSKIYLAFFLLAGLSIITAINPTEAWVCYARIIATVVAFFNISILLNGRVDLFRLIAQILGLILLVESLQTISLFLNGIGTTELTLLIKSLKGTAGNKNIFAAGLIVKIPFVLYCIHTSKLWGRILNIGILLLAASSIFIINARAAYVSLLLILVLYFVFCLLEYLKDKNLVKGLYRISYILIPVIIAFMVSQVQLSNAELLQDAGAGKDFGSVTERLGSVTKTDDESNQVRLRLWVHAIDYTKHHPFIGCGTGNWKIASIPYQRTITNDLYVPIHAHNDFVETFAEIGIPGGLLYLGMFIAILVFTIRTYRSEADEETKLASVFSFLAFVGYGIDALFNFPTERPISQMFFAFIAAVNVMAYIQARKESDDIKTISPVLLPLYGLISLLILLPSAYVSYMVYKSFLVQRTLLGDLENEPLKLDWKTVLAELPSIPNLTATAQPVDAIKGRYLYEAARFKNMPEKYAEALVYLEKGRKANPVIGYSEFLKAGVYFNINKLDSAARNATVAFYLRPKAKTYFQTLVAVLAQQKDTNNIKKAYAEYDKYRHHPFGLNLFILGMMTAGVNDERMLTTIDTSFTTVSKEYQNDSVILVRRKEIVNNILVKKSLAAGQKPLDINLANQYYQQGIAAFGSGNPEKDDLDKAAELFLKAAKITPNNYIIYENAAMSYFNKHEYAKAIIYFDKVLAMGNVGNGKSEFFKGVALLSIGRKEGCTYLLMAQKKNYKEKEADLKAILKSHCGGQ